MDRHWDTALYYMFSTIAQTLAGALALLGAFVLYKMQILTASAEPFLGQGALGSSIDAINSAASANECKRIVAQEKAKAPMNMSLGFGLEMISPTELLDRFGRLVLYRKRVLREFRRIVVCSGIVIGVSFIGVGIAPAIAGYPNLSIAVLVLGGTLVCFCLFLIVKFLIASVE